MCTWKYHNETHYFDNNNKEISLEAEEITQPLRACIVLAGDSGSVPSSHTAAQNKSSSKVSFPSHPAPPSNQLYAICSNCIWPQEGARVYRWGRTRPVERAPFMGLWEGHHFCWVQISSRAFWEVTTFLKVTLHLCLVHKPNKLTGFSRTNFSGITHRFIVGTLGGSIYLPQEKIFQ